MKLGFIGCGNMATAMIRGIIKNNIVKAEEIIGSNSTKKNATRTKEALGIVTTTDNKEVVRNADFIFLGVKPQIYEPVLQEIKGELDEKQVIISIAPGKTIQWFEEQLSESTKIVRTMPNTPACVGEGMTGVCCNTQVTPEELEAVSGFLRGFGRMEMVPEGQMDVVSAVSGSSPAYVYMFIEAMADAAVAEGMARDKAYQFAAQAVLGSAKMVMETGKHPGALKDEVCSPSGSTIQGVRVLEKNGMRSAVFEALEACINQTKNM
ncbi:MAG: pyrroline-5-carboxylate reductase [Lachnospiraceae bacterium]